ncbi:MAG: hypothetical protein ACK4P3_04315 [Fimbriimonadaceae bacterium]
MPIDLIINHSQPRPAGIGTSALFCGGDWGPDDSRWPSPTFRDGIFQDPFTGTLMLAPLALEPAWYQNFSGEYSRMRLTDLQGNGGDVLAPGWFEHRILDAGDVWLTRRTGAQQVETVAHWEPNQPFFLSWFSFGRTAEEFRAMECGWEGEGSKVALRFWNSGRCEVWVNDVLEGEYSVSGSSVPRLGDALNTWACLIPYRDRELLVLTSRGGGFSHGFTEGFSEVPAGKFGFLVPEGSTSVQLAPLRFRTKGFLISHPRVLPRVPLESREFVSQIWSDGDGDVAVKLLEADSLEEFVADGEADEVRLRLEMNSDGDRTPFVHAVRTSFTEEIEMTAASPLSVGGQLREVRLEVDEKGCRLRAVLGELPEGLGLHTPLRLEVDSVVWFEGLVDSLVFEDGQWVASAADRSLLASETVLLDAVPIDGLLLSEAIQELLGRAGIPLEDIEIGGEPVQLPFGSRIAQAEFLAGIDAGATVLPSMNGLLERFAPRWWHGWRPAALGWKWYFGEPVAPEDPYVRLFEESGEEAAAYRTEAFGEDPPETVKSLVWSLERNETAAAANEVWVLGREDLGAAVRQRPEFLDASLLPSERGAGWTGYPKTLVVQHEGLTESEDLSRFADVMCEREAAPRELTIVKCWAQQHPGTGLPLWRGDVVQLPDESLQRVLSFSLRFRFEADGFLMREATYTLAPI